MKKFKIGDRVTVKDNYTRLGTYDSNQFYIMFGLEGKSGEIVGTQDFDGCQGAIGIKFDEITEGCHDLEGIVKYGYGYWLEEEMLTKSNSYEVSLL